MLTFTPEITSWADTGLHLHTKKHHERRHTHMYTPEEHHERRHIGYVYACRNTVNEDILTFTPEDTSWTKTHIYAWKYIMKRRHTFTPEDTSWTKTYSRLRPKIHHERRHAFTPEDISWTKTYSRLRLNKHNQRRHRLLTFTPEETSWTKTYTFTPEHLHHERKHSFTPEETLWNEKTNSRLHPKKHRQRSHGLLTFTAEETSWTKTYIYT